MSPSIWEPTPEEHIDAVCQCTWKEGKDRLPPPPPGYVRVEMYRDMYRITEKFKADLEADFPLEHCGDLDLTQVHERWGMDRCSAFDLRMLRPFESVDPERLSALAVVVLSEGTGVIRVFETYVSPATQRKRQVRQLFFHLCAIFINRRDIILTNIWNFLEPHFDPIPPWLVRWRPSDYKPLERLRYWPVITQYTHSPFSLLFLVLTTIWIVFATSALGVMFSFINTLAHASPGIANTNHHAIFARTSR